MKPSSGPEIESLDLIIQDITEPERIDRYLADVAQLMSRSQL